MSRFVLDASVVVKWFVDEIHTEPARRLQELDHTYYAPDLMFVEAAAAIRKSVRRHDLGASEAVRAIGALATIGVESVASRPMVGDAFAISQLAGVTIYDAVYLALALRLACRLVTADERAARLLRQYPEFAGKVQLIQDFS